MSQRAILPGPVSLSKVGWLLGVAAVYGLAYFVQVMIVRTLGVVPVIWPAHAFAAAFTLTQGWRWPQRWGFYGALFAALFASNIALAHTPWRAIWFSVIQIISVIGVVEAYLLACKTPPDVRTMRGLLRFIVPTALLPAIPIAVFGTWVETFWIKLDFREIASHWVIIHALATSIGGVFYLTFRRDILATRWTALRLLEVATLVAAAVGITTAVQFNRSTEFLFALAPVLAWGAVRYRLGGAATLVFVIGMTGTAVQGWLVLDAAHGSWSTLMAFTNAAPHAPAVNADIDRLQRFLMFVCAPVIGLAALAAEHEANVAVIAAQRAEADRMSEEKSRLLLTVSHDLKNPLNAVINLSDLIARGLMGPVAPSQAEGLAAIHASGLQMNAMAGQLVEMAKLEGGSMAVSVEPVPLDEAVRRAIANIRHHPLAEGVEIQFEAEAGLVARADPGRLQQVVENLGSNAVKYGGSGGRVVIKTRRLDAAQVRIQVTDFGAGIPAEKADRVFRQFDRLDAEHGGVEGAGVGLAMAKKMTELQGGRMGFASQPGVETVFWIDLPIAA